LASLGASDIQIASRNDQITDLKAQVANFVLQVAKDKEIDAAQEERFQKVLAILKQYASLDNKAKKGFWAKVGHDLEEILKAVTNVTSVASIIEIMLLIKAGK